MSTLTEQFAKNAYQPTYFIGDRVFGYWNKVPFVGSVGNDRDKVGDSGPEITVHLDLPLQYKGEIKSVVIVRHEDVKPLKVLD